MSQEMDALKAEVADIKAAGEAVVSAVAELHGQISALEVARATAGEDSSAVAEALASLKATAASLRGAVAKATSADPAFPADAGAGSASEDHHTAA
jgi:hypothetical protein